MPTVRFWLSASWIRPRKRDRNDAAQCPVDSLYSIAPTELLGGNLPDLRDKLEQVLKGLAMRFQSTSTLRSDRKASDDWRVVQDDWRLAQDFLEGRCERICRKGLRQKSSNI